MTRERNEPARLGAVSRDERLRQARRVDWRFLLPTPELGRVALGGVPESSLHAALAGLRGSPVPALPTSGGGGQSPAEPFDTVVLSGRIKRSDLIAATAAVAERGHLVIELHGPVQPTLRLGERPGSATRIKRSLRAGGFEVREWLVWPSLDKATAFARADDPAAIRAWLNRRLGRRPASAIGIAMRGRIGSALFAVAPALVLVARRGVMPASLVERRLAACAVPGGGRLILAPRYRASAHIVGLAIARDTSIEGVVKIARLRDDRSLDHEAAVLAALARSGPAARSGPRLVDAPGLATEIGDDPWPTLVETGVDGEALDPAAVRRDRGGTVEAIRAWLATLPVGPPGDRKVDVATRLDAALAAVERMDDGSADGRRLAGLVARTRPLVASLAARSMPLVFEHGDPAHPNLLVRSDGTIAAVDWERGEPDGLPLHDLTISMAYVAAAARGATQPTEQAAAFRAAMSDDDPWAAAALDEELARLGCDPASRPALIIAAWARSAAWLVDHLADPETSDELTRWLAADRSVALWAAALDLAEGV
jgi:hypothetical protein